MTSSEFAREIFAIVEAKIRCTPSPTEFEMAYQARVAIEKIRFAIKELERPSISEPVTLEVGLQLADALDRLEGADRSFQERFHSGRMRPAQERHNGGNGAHVSQNRL
jgi:hypothetical protein